MFPKMLGRSVVISRAGKIATTKYILRPSDHECYLIMGIMKNPTRHSSLRCRLTEQRSTLSVFCCKAVWEMATLNTSLNKMDSVGG